MFKDLLPGSVTQTFDLIDIAEEEIQKGIDKFPESRNEIWSMFLSLCPTTLLCRHPTLYRSHCKELIERVGNKEFDNEPTSAELCFAFSEMSLKAPLKSDMVAAYYRCFREAFPESDIDMDVSESYPGAVDEIIQQIKRRLIRERSLV